MSWGAVASAAATAGGAYLGSKSSGGGAVSQKPWKRAIPYLMGQDRTYDAEGNLTHPFIPGVLPGASNLYQQGPTEYYPGSTVAPRSQATLNAESGMYNLANRFVNNLDGNSGWSAFRPMNMMNQVGTTALGMGQNPQAPNLDSNLVNRAVGTTGQRIDNGPIRTPVAPSGGGQSLGLLGAPTALNSTLSRIMQGTPNQPYLDQMSTAATRQTRNAFDDYRRDMQRSFDDQLGSLRGDFGGAGQYGGERHKLMAADVAERQADALSRFGDRSMAQIGDVNTNLYGDAYSQAQQQALGAAGTAAGMQNTLTGARASMYGADRSVDRAAMGNAANLAISQGQLGLGAQELGLNSLGQAADAAQALPGLQQAPFNMFGNMLGVGGRQDAYNQIVRDADVDRWDFNQDNRWDALERYANLVNTVAGRGSTTTQPSGSRAAGALGGMLAANTLYNNFSDMDFGGLLGGGG